MTTPNLPNKDAIAAQLKNMTISPEGEGLSPSAIAFLLDLLTTTANARVEQFAAELEPYLHHNPGCWIGAVQITKNDCECGLLRLSPLSSEEQERLLAAIEAKEPTS